MTDELKTAIEAAKVGAKKALTYFKNFEDLSTQYKADNTPLTLADKETEIEIKNYIRSKFPDAKILGEETGGSSEHDSFWVIDPIDGTRSFVRGIDTWAVITAYYSKNEFKIGVCYFPCLNKLFYAEKGKGAWLNKKRIHASKIDKLQESYINYGNPKYFENREVIFELIDTCRSARSKESTLADALVAEGKMDGAIDPYAKLWDFSSLSVIIPEAGGRITNLSGNDLALTDVGCIMSNGLIHKELTDIVSK